MDELERMLDSKVKGYHISCGLEGKWIYLHNMKRKCSKCGLTESWRYG